MRRIFIALVASFAVTALATAQDVTGTIRTTDGTPIEGIVVTDGHTVITTDAEGRYAFDRHEEAAYVYYSLPAEYRVPLRQGHPCFYKKLTDDAALDDSAAQIETYFDEAGNLVDEDGNILISAEDLENAQLEAENSQEAE